MPAQLPDWLQYPHCMCNSVCSYSNILILIVTIELPLEDNLVHSCPKQPLVRTLHATMAWQVWSTW